MSTPLGPFAVILANGNTFDAPDWDTASEMVRLYGATWKSYDRAFTAIDEQRKLQRSHGKVIDAKSGDYRGDPRGNSRGIPVEDNPSFVREALK